MVMSGGGISPTTFKIKPGYKPDTRLAIEWGEANNGEPFGVDRGAASDIYRCKVDLYGKLSAIESFVDAVEANRRAASAPHVLTLSDFNDGEKVFGADVDYTGTLSATVVDVKPIVQGTWKGFGVSAVLRVLSPSFVGTPSLPALECLEIGYAGDASRTVNKFDSYTGAFAYIEHDSDVGRFVGTFKFSESDMRSFRRYVSVTARASTVSLTTIGGVAEPFGSRRAGSYPYSAKITGFNDLGLWGLQFWRAEIEFSEVVV